MPRELSGIRAVTEPGAEKTGCMAASRKRCGASSPAGAQHKTKTEIATHETHQEQQIV